MRRTLRSKIVNARQKLARLINCDESECVIVPGATHGIATILFNLKLKPGDILIKCMSIFYSSSVYLNKVPLVSTAYYAINLSIQYHADKIPGVAVSTVELTFPTSHADIVKKFRDHIESLPRHDGQTVVAIIDSINSCPGVVLPWDQLVAVCKEHKVFSIIDAAHEIGQVSIDLNVTQPDAWVSVRMLSFARLARTWC